MIADLLPSALPASLSMHTVQWIEFVLATPVVCGVVGRFMFVPFYR